MLSPCAGEQNHQSMDYRKHTEKYIIYTGSLANVRTKQCRSTGSSQPGSTSIHTYKHRKYHLVPTNLQTQEVLHRVQLTYVRTYIQAQEVLHEVQMAYKHRKYVRTTQGLNGIQVQEVLHRVQMAYNRSKYYTGSKWHTSTGILHRVQTAYKYRKYYIGSKRHTSTGNTTPGPNGIQAQEVIHRVQTAYKYRKYYTGSKRHTSTGSTTPGLNGIQAQEVLHRVQTAYNHRKYYRGSNQNMDILLLTLQPTKNSPLNYSLKSRPTYTSLC